MSTDLPGRAPRPACAVALALAAVILAGACTATPPRPSQDAPGSDPGSSAPAVTSSVSPTSPLFGQPPPVDPCLLVTAAEASIVLEKPVSGAREETSGGAASSCIYSTDEARTRVAVTVVKTPQTPVGYTRRKQSLGQRAQDIPDLGNGVYTVIFGPNVTVTALKGGIEFYIDVAKEPRSGGQIREPALALMERALTRVPTPAAHGEDAA